MHLVLTMAGLYSRFKSAGYEEPKFLLEVENKSILEIIIRELCKDYSFENIILIANKRDLKYKTEIENIIKNINGNIYLEYVGDTVGQAHTALCGIEFLKKIDHKSKKVVFHNIDTILKGIDFSKVDKILDEYSGYIDIFESDSVNYSYVCCNEIGVLTEMKEKVVISNMATSGLYCFSNYSLYERYYKQCSYDNEFYISSIYNKYIMNRENIFIDKTVLNSKQEIVILGTPKEYEDFKRILNEKNI